MEKLYQEIILDHYRTPHHQGLRAPFDAEVHHVNPTCGDEITLRVKLVTAEQTGDDPENAVRDAALEVRPRSARARPQSGGR